MKRFLCMLMALTALMAMNAALADVNLDDMSLESLYDLRKQVNARIEALEQQTEEQVYDSGLYGVGDDIPAGDYVLIENENAVFASVIVREEASEDSGLVTHHLINGQAVIRLTEGTWVTFSEARAYPLKQAPKSQDGYYGDGGYLVGETLPAGEYDLTIADMAPLSSYSIYDDILGADAHLIKFEVLHDVVAVELNVGEYIELSGCRLGPHNTATEDTVP